MPGTHTSGRPGGNPDIKKYGFKTDRDEPLRERLQIRVPASMKQQLLTQESRSDRFTDSFSARVII